MLRRISLVAALVFASAGGVRADVADLTIEVGGDLLKHGGVVTVYPIRSSAEEWASGGGKINAPIRLTARYAEVQLRYPMGGTYVYRFRAVGAGADSQRFVTQALSIIGTDEQDRGPRMKTGFKDAYSSGGRIIRVPAAAEYAGEDEATRTNARWGRTERIDEPPPADERSVRSLVPIMQDNRHQPLLECGGDLSVQACIVPADTWPLVEMRWWRAIAEQRLERLHHHALRRCHDSSWFGGGACDADQRSDEPHYTKRITP
jgi:hypothetical protein